MHQLSSNLVPCRVVLVRPRIAANIGAVARVMRNMGVDQLVLVAPEADRNDPRARLLATHSEDILERALVVPELGEALADCGLVAGTSARRGGLYRKQAVGPPGEILPALMPSLSSLPLGLVFGPEDIGLSNDEISRCHYLLQIPTDPVHPALNLAQAVAVCLYELRQAWCRREQAEPPKEPASSFAYQEIMFDKLRTALEAIHFLYGPKADSLLFALRHLIGRAQPTEQEVDLLFGLARQIQWFAEDRGSLGDRKETNPNR